MATIVWNIPWYFRVRQQFTMIGTCIAAILVVMSYFVRCATGDIVRLTMVTPTPYSTETSPVTMTCFRSSPDTAATLTFGRPFAIALPGSTIQPTTSLPAGYSINGQTITLPPSVDSVAGLFYCEGAIGGLTTRVYNIIHSYNRRFEPAGGLVTRTINKGEGVTLSVQSYNNLGTTPLWRRISNGSVTSVDGFANQYTTTIDSTEANHGDLYVVIQSAVITGDNHFSMIRLVVRGCSAGKWDPPSCTGVCDLCYNGGVCDDKTGQCICAPGFIGTNCLTACGSSRFGWNCEFTCGPGNIIPSCSGSQFGLPDPYGSSCYIGYTGTYCDTLCLSGTFGAGCTQSCHCFDGALCNISTGVCPSSCASGWYGTNCQVSYVCPVGYYAVECLRKCHCLNDAFCEKDSGYCSGSNGVCAMGYTCVSALCPTGYFGASCSDLCHCENDGKCHQITGYCFESNGICASGFASDNGTINCQTGITEFQMLMMVNIGQDAIFSCAATSGDTLTLSSLSLFDGSSDVFSTDSVTMGNTLNNTFTVSGLIQDQVVSCYLSIGGTVVSVSLFVSFYALPVLSQPPGVTVSSITSAIVRWLSWGSHAMDAGDGPVNTYRVLYTPVPPVSWIFAGNVSVMDQSQATYSFVVEPLEPDTQYSFSVSAVREGTGGEGPRSPKVTRRTLPVTAGLTTTLPTTKSGTTTAPPNGIGTSLIAVICVIVVVVILLALVIPVYYMRRRRNETQSASKQHQTVVGQEMCGVEASSPSIYEDVGLPTWAQHWSIPWKSMLVGNKIIGEGSFGEVRDGAVMIEDGVRKAAIKKLKTNTSSTEGQNFMKEFQTMTKIGSHPNIVGILGACERGDVLYVALEYLPNGDLRSYLRKVRSPDGNSETSLTAEKMLQFALDVAKGMHHLATSGVIHRDLAARNILLGDDLVAKVSDFGLSRGEDVYVQTSKTRVPILWLSLESLTCQTYTSKSDVWSFGILLWEIVTFAGTPYPDIKVTQLASKLTIGYRMPKPSNCEDEIHDVMLQCWQEDPNERPSFKELVSILDKMAHKTIEHTYFTRISPESDDCGYVNIRPDDD